MQVFYLLVFLLLSFFETTAQSNENPKELEQKISTAKNDSKKIELLLELSNYYLTKEGEIKSDLDSALKFNSQARQLSDKINSKIGKGKSMLLEAKILREKGQVEISLAKIKQAIAYFENNAMNEELGDGYNALTYHYDNSPENIVVKIGLKTKALEIFKKAKANEKQANLLKELGELYILKSDPDTAVDLLKQSLAKYQSIKFKKVQDVYNFLAQAEIQKANYEEALKYGLLAERLALQLNDNSKVLGSIYSNVGKVYYSLRQNDDAMQYWKKALAIAQKSTDNNFVRSVTSDISTMLIRQRKFEEAIAMIKENKARYPITDKQLELTEDYILFSTYTILKQFNNASIYYKKLANNYGEYAEKDDNQLVILRSFIFYHYQTKDFEKMYPKAKVFDSVVQKVGNNLLRSENHLIWFKADSVQGKYADAIKHYQLYKKFSDSVFNGEKSNQINSLKIQFESEKKDKNIKFLTQQSKLQEAKIANDTFIKYVFIGSIVVLVLFLALLYNRSRLKNNANKKLELKRQQIDEQNEQLKKLLSEKEWLLKEIHHRVKNNLQIVISLLNTQSAYLDNEDALLAIQNSQHRMHAMSLIHQKLYQSDNLASIDMSWYIYELVNYMKECFGTEKKINFILETEKVYLDVAQAVPLGLIINEAINNTIKYAFPNGNKGNVLVSLKNIGENKYELIISDNGIGLPADFNIDETDSLGMNLMRGLSDQLDASFSLRNENGLKIEITFIKNIEFEASAENSTTL